MDVNEDFDPIQLTLRKFTVRQYPLNLPWTTSSAAMGEGFDSRKLTTDNVPWVAASGLANSQESENEFLIEIGGGRVTYNDAISSSAGSGSEHLSASLGVSVSCPFLSAGVTASYDKMIMDSKSSTKLSRTCTYQVGRITFRQPPKLSLVAHELLESKSPDFCRVYGDYYVSALELGSTAGVCLSGEQSNSVRSGSSSVTTQVKILFQKSKNRTTSTSSHESSAVGKLDCCAFDSLNQSSQNLHADTGGSTYAIDMTVSEYLEHVASLQRRTDRRLKDVGFKHGQHLSARECKGMAGSGLVLGLVLMPYTALFDYKMKEMKDP